MERRDLTNGAEQRDFFISYTKTDKAWAVWIADVLKRNGYSVYYQALDIRPGDDFLEKMEEFLENSRNFIAVWSQGYSKSKYCMNELRAAFHEWNAGRVNCLLPVRVDNHPMKALYAALVHVQLSDMGAESEAELADAVRRAVPRVDTVTDTGAAPPVDTEPNTPEEYAEMLFQRGEDYYYGRNGVNQDYVKAREYYERAAKQCHAEALFSLGVLYYKGDGVRQDYAKAREYYEQAAAKGHATALHNLGVLYRYGQGVVQDYAKAREYWELAAKQGHAETLSALGVLYHYGYGVAQNYAKAREYYEQAAAKGDAGALCNLGALYGHGYGVKQDYAKARDYWEQAAAKGHAIALYALGSYYEYGQGVAVDYAKALQYYQKAADRGHKRAPAKAAKLHEKLKC